MHYDEKGRAICQGCGTVMTKITREDRSPKVMWECPDQECTAQPIATYDRTSEGEA